jgi:DNA-binding IclR family transcriptional regulator
VLSGTPWLAALDDDDQAAFFAEMGNALETAAARRDAEPLEACLREWRTTAEALSDPLRRAVLTGNDDDYAEVTRP